MYSIDSDRFDSLMKGAQPMDVDGWDMDDEVEAKGYPLLESFDSGEHIGVSSGQWEERAQLYDYSDSQQLLRFQEVYWGECFGDKEPRYFLVDKA